jgi:Ca-activated chloride channel family protein
LVNEMRPEDKVSIVVYAGAAGVVLPPTSGTKKDIILSALNNLTAGGSTAGGQGIEMAYKLAEKNLDKDGNNRIILATDGDFNVGMSGDDELVKLIEEKRKTGISLSVMGFGTGNLNNSMMEKVADNGNGNYSYIDNVMEAKKVFVTEMGGTLFTIAKDVKLQLEFNPSAVKSYRLLGYENRMLAPEDFNDDLKDAGELGAGHCVIALYELVPADDSKTVGESADLKYQSKTIVKNADNANDLVTIKFRYKEPNGTKSKLITKVVTNRMMPFNSYNFKFASSVAEFGLIIRDSEFKADANMDNLIDRARNSKGTDLNGYRSEFVNLAEKAQMLLDDYLVNYKDQ